MTLDELLDYPPYIAFQLDSWLMSMQQLTGVGFDQEGARKLVASVTVEMDAIASEIEPQLPPKPLNKGELKEWTLPAKPFKKDGSLSASMESWLVKRGAAVDGGGVVLDGERYPLVGGGLTKTTGRMTLANQDDLKNWLVESGWTPTLWNVKKDVRGKPERDERGQMIRTTPKMQENGRLCPNLEEMGGDLVRPVVRWLSLRNRRSVVEGWLANERLAFDGRLGAGASGVTPTFRARHTVITNLPKAEEGVLLGKEVRGLFIPSEPGHVFVGFDAAGLENRNEASYCSKYEGGKEHAETILNGDPHSNNAFVFYKDQLIEEAVKVAADPAYLAELKKVPGFKALRGKAKAGRYALAYGCSPAKLAKTLGFPESRGQELYDDFWAANPALKCLKDRLESHWESNNKRWIRAIDGRRVQTRSKHSLVNSLFQSCGSIVMEYAIAFLHKQLGPLVLDKDGRPGYNYKSTWAYRVGFFHDELLLECHPSVAEEILEMGKESIRRSGRFLKMAVPLDAGGAIGNTYAEVH